MDKSLDNFRIGEFSIFSFYKSFFPTVLEDNWNFIQNLKDFDHEELLEKSLVIFAKLSEKEKKQYIVELATDNHESHHFHQYMLLPVGEVVFNIFWSTLHYAIPLYAKLKDQLDSGIEPFSESINPVFPNGLKNHLDYYLCGSLLPGQLGEKIFTNQYTYMFDFKHLYTGKLPVVILKGRTYPIGVVPLLESWTWSVVKAMVFMHFPHEYFKWYEGTKNSQRFWHYNLLEMVLLEIFEDYFANLNPVEKCKIISTIVICSCTIDPTPTEDFFQSQENHPGWHFQVYLESLWVNKKALIGSKVIDVDKCCNSIYRTMKQFYSYSFGDRLCDISFSLKDDERAKKDDLLSFIYTFLKQTQLAVTKEFLNNNNTFYLSTTYLDSKHRGLLPKIPMAIAHAPDSNYFHLAFPAGENVEYWFTWFMFSQTYLNILSGVHVCPIAHYSLDMPCDRDSTCMTLKGLTKKNETCYLCGFIRGNSYKF